MSVAQAGLTVGCECGQQMEVPTRGALAGLERRGEATVAAGRPARPVWGPRQGLMYVGCVAAVVFLAAGTYLWLNPPEDLVPGLIERATPAYASSLFYEQFSGGIDVSHHDYNKDLAQRIKSHRVWMITWFVLSGLGLLTAAASRLIAPGAPGGGPRRVKRREAPAPTGR